MPDQNLSPVVDAPKSAKVEKEVRNDQYLLHLVALGCVICAFLRGFFPNQIDEKTAIFLGLAVVTLVIDKVTKFKGFGIEFEKEVEQLKEDVEDVKKNVEGVEAAVGGLEREIGPGSKSGNAGASLVRPGIVNTEGVTNPDDPNKGRFGKSAEANFRKITATITPAAGPKSSRCEVRVKVQSTDPENHPLKGKVTLHLHPTFGKWTKYDLDVRGGLAEDKLISYGAFTIGAEADGGETRLELDLVDVPGGTKAFYEN